jgi:hypothetical protein
MITLVIVRLYFMEQRKEPIAIMLVKDAMKGPA